MEPPANAPQPLSKNIFLGLLLDKESEEVCAVEFSMNAKPKNTYAIRLVNSL